MPDLNWSAASVKAQASNSVVCLSWDQATHHSGTALQFLTDEGFLVVLCPLAAAYRQQLPSVIPTHELGTRQNVGLLLRNLNQAAIRWMQSQWHLRSSRATQNGVESVAIGACQGPILDVCGIRLTKD